MSLVGLGCTESDSPDLTPSVKPSAVKAKAPNAPESPAPVKASPGEAALVDRGRAVYVANCSACHNADPALPGSLGPEVAGSSAGLLEARLLRNTYPAGYTPKRDSRVMMALPYLKDDIPALAAYLRN